VTAQFPESEAPQKITKKNLEINGKELGIRRKISPDVFSGGRTSRYQPVCFHESEKLIRDLGQNLPGQVKLGLG